MREGADELISYLVVGRSSKLTLRRCRSPGGGCGGGCKSGGVEREEPMCRRQWRAERGREYVERPWQALPSISVQRSNGEVKKKSNQQQLIRVPSAAASSPNKMKGAGADLRIGLQGLDLTADIKRICSKNSIGI